MPDLCRRGGARVHHPPASSTCHCGTGIFRGGRDGISACLFTFCPSFMTIRIATLHREIQINPLHPQNPMPSSFTKTPPPSFKPPSLVASLPQDTTFSCVVTALFLRPMFKILGVVGDVRSEGQVSLEKTKWLALLGASLAVISSTAVFIHQCWVACGAGRLRKTDLGQPLLARPGLRHQPGLRPERHW